MHSINTERIDFEDMIDLVDDIEKRAFLTRKFRGYESTNDSDLNSNSSSEISL